MPRAPSWPRRSARPLPRAKSCSTSTTARYSCSMHGQPNAFAVISNRSIRSPGTFPARTTARILKISLRRAFSNPRCCCARSSRRSSARCRRQPSCTNADPASPRATTCSRWRSPGCRGRASIPGPGASGLPIPRDRSPAADSRVRPAAAARGLRLALVNAGVAQHERNRGNDGGDASADKSDVGRVLPLEHIAEKGDEHHKDYRLRHDHLEVLELAHLEPPWQGGFAVKKERSQPEGDDVEDRSKQEQIENLECRPGYRGDVGWVDAAERHLEDRATDGDRCIDRHGTEHDDAADDGYDEKIPADAQNRLHSSPFWRVAHAVTEAI